MPPFDMEQTWLECMDCGLRADLLAERQFRCPKCHGLYDVNHRFLDHIPFPEMVASFDRRRAGATVNTTDSSLYTSGVWRFREWIAQYLPEDQIITLHEGNVPIMRAGYYTSSAIGGELELYLILEGMTPTGSFKDFGMTVLVSIAKAAGATDIACASTGDTSASAAAYAAAGGLRCTVILPKGKVTAVQLSQPLAYDAQVLLLPCDFDGCMRIMQELVSCYGVYPANSLNPARIEGHQATVFQIAQYLDWDLPDWIAVPVGNGSNCSSIGKAIRLLNQLGIQKVPRILGCQSQAASPLAQSWQQTLDDCGEVTLPEWKQRYQPTPVGETIATAARIGDPVSAAKVMREITYTNGAMVMVDEIGLKVMTIFCGQDGIAVCPQTGTALAGVDLAVESGLIEPGSRVFVVSTATGLKFPEITADPRDFPLTELPTCSIEQVAKHMGISQV